MLDSSAYSSRFHSDPILQSLYESARALLPDLTLPYFLGMTGLAVHTPYTSMRCSCSIRITNEEVYTRLTQLGIERLPSLADPSGDERIPKLRKSRGRTGSRLHREIIAVAELA